MIQVEERDDTKAWEWKDMYVEGQCNNSRCPFQINTPHTSSWDYYCLLFMNLLFFIYFEWFTKGYSVKSKPSIPVPLFPFI